MKVVCRNDRTMLDKANCSRTYRKSGLIANKLFILDIDTAVLSVASLVDDGSIQGLGAGFTLFWSGKQSTSRRLSDVGFIVRNSISSKQESSPTCHYDRIISLRLPLKSNHFSRFSVTIPKLYWQIPRSKTDYFQICAYIWAALLQMTNSLSLASLTLELVWARWLGK